ncbi:GTPase family protein [Lonepinella sp. BR2474]|uniref:GTPase family protein n=1 Tax=Lonepinella sp. BR2474 TaxID=3434548 RepID=UPI003F6E3B95
MSINRQQTSEQLNSVLSKMPIDVRELMKTHLEKTIFYTPRVGIMGKSGAGKSTLANSLVGKRVFKTGGVGGCTRSFQEEKLAIGSREIAFVDLPGIAENKERHEEYLQLYEDKIKDLDIILWVIKVDDRANVDDERFYEWLIQKYKKEQIIFVLSQSDKAEPTRGWNYETYQPSDKQLDIISQNQARISDAFNIDSDDVVPVACEFIEDECKFDRYNIDKLVTKIVNKVPQNAKSSLLASVDKDNQTTEAKSDAQDAFGNIVENVIDTALDVLPIPTPVKTVIKSVKKDIVKVVKGLWNTFFG